MSLRGRVITVVALMLLISISLYVAIEWRSARSDLAAELDAARTGGLQTVRSAFEDLPRSDHPERDLRQLVATFDGNRHLAADVVDARGQHLLRSHPALPPAPAPAWFARLLRADLTPAAVPVPGESAVILTLQPQPASDIAALWSAVSGAAGVFVIAAAVGLALIYWVIGRALAPLADLSHGLHTIGASGYRERVGETGPPELHDLQLGFNAMAERLAEIDERNRALEAQLLTIQDEERADIARDLHDEIGPHLFAVALDAEMIGLAMKRNDVALVAEHVGSIQAAISYVQRQVRELIASLRPTGAAELGLEAAIADLIGFWRARRPEVEFEASLGGADAFVSERLREVIYRVVQESVANALRHAETTRLAVAVAEGNERVMVTVGNRGPARPKAAELPGLGLVSMRERVQAAGGSLHIDRSDMGWTVAASFPSSAERRAA